MRSVLSRAGLLGWRQQVKLIGKPDFYWKARRVVLFVDGCFWHGCPRCQKLPSDYDVYWKGRIQKNRMRDRWVNRALSDKGWRVVRIWECRIAGRDTVRRLKRALELGATDQ